MYSKYSLYINKNIKNITVKSIDNLLFSSIFYSPIEYFCISFIKYYPIISFNLDKFFDSPITSIGISINLLSTAT